MTSEHALDNYYMRAYYQRAYIRESSRERATGLARRIRDRDVGGSGNHLEHFPRCPGWKTWNAGIEHIDIDGPFAAGTWFTMKPPGEDPLARS